MRIFISSVIRGFEQYRDAAAKAARTLRLEVKRAEDFGASPDSPQRVCLAGVRESDITVLLLGSNYGQPQGPEQLSPTHEEYREARDRKPVLVFIQDGVTRVARQQQFVDEVQAWSRGHYTERFSTPDELQGAVVRALHELTLARSAGPVNEAELTERAKHLLPRERGYSSSASLCVVIAGGPKQAAIRPAQLESESLSDEIIKAATFGPDRVFDRGQGTKAEIENHALVIKQDDASVLLTQLGDVRVLQPARSTPEGSGFQLSGLVAEDIQERITRALRFSAWLLDHVDPNRRLQTVLPLAAILNGQYAGWTTRSERAAHPGRMMMKVSHSDGPTLALLAPPTRPRPALSLQADEIAEDMTVLLGRELRA